jgi:hypothetical protein
VDTTTATIPLYGLDGSVRAHVLVDEIDAVWLSHWCWRLHGSGYAYRYELVDTKWWPVFMHRELLGLPRKPGRIALTVDHLNRDRLGQPKAQPANPKPSRERTEQAVYAWLIVALPWGQLVSAQRFLARQR